MKQTAVEWLINELHKKNSSGMSYKHFEEIFKQAKQMERVQKSEEYLKGFKDGKEYQIKLDELTFKTK
jgi:hypothetical protein